MKGPDQIISSTFYKDYKIARGTCPLSSWPRLLGSSETSRPWFQLFFDFFEAITFLKPADDELWHVPLDSIFQGLQYRQRDLFLLLPAQNFSGQIPRKWSVLGYTDLWGSPKTSGQRVILPMLAKFFYTLQLPYYRSSPNSRPFVMVSRISRKRLDLSQVDQKRLFEENGAQPSHGHYRAREIVSDADRASASTGFIEETMNTVKWIPTWRKVYQHNTSRKQSCVRVCQLP